MKINSALVSPCGLYCGVCAIYIVHRDNNLKLKVKLLIFYNGEASNKGKLLYAEKLIEEEARYICPNWRE